MKRPSLMDREFKYTPAAESDIRLLFERIRAEIEAAREPAKQPANVRPLRTKGAA